MASRIAEEGLDGATVRIPFIDESLESELRGRFQALADTFNGFEQTLLRRKAQRRDDDDRRIETLLVEIRQVEASLDKEAQRRAETAAAMKAMVDARLAALQVELEAPVAPLFAALDERCKAIDARIAAVEANVDNDRAAVPKQIEDRSKELLQELKEFKARFAMEQTIRASREKELTRNIAEGVQQGEKRFAAQRFMSEQKFKQLNMDISAEEKVRRKDCEVLHGRTGERLDQLRKSLEECNAERVRTTSEVAKAFVHYVAALQDGVNILSLGN